MIHASNNLIICIEKNKRKEKIYKKRSEKKKKKEQLSKKGTKCPKVSGESNAYELYLKLECMNM